MYVLGSNADKADRHSLYKHSAFYGQTSDDDETLYEKRTAWCGKNYYHLLKIPIQI